MTAGAKGIVSYVEVNYKKIAFCQSSNGYFNKSILHYCAFETPEAFRTSQTNDQIKNLSESAILTLIGLAILHKNYQSHFEQWKLIYQKGVNVLLNELGTGSADAIKAILSSVETNSIKDY